MNRDAVLEGLNEQQLHAVEIVRGPVCILAGAGTGKTTTITRRIANQVATRAFAPQEILAVTFTDKAAGEMRRRLGDLGVSGVRARTFHSAALAQLRHLGADPPGDVLSTKATALRQLANRLPRPHRFCAVADLASEIEWAKNRRIRCEDYLEKLSGHQPPIPPELMHRIYVDYERGKQQRRLIDFEDLLELAIRLFHEDSWAVEQFQARYRAFTVDEFQDVNRLQYDLLLVWIGERDELCAVGDDYQSIYGFTGATPDHLLKLPGRFNNTSVVRLETNYRSTPEILSFANLLVPALGGATKRLRAVEATGPEPVVRGFFEEDAETSFIVERIKELHLQGVAYEDMAVLYRTNYRSGDYESALAAAHVPYQVRDTAFLHRPAARSIIRSFARSTSTDVAQQVGASAQRHGWIEDPPSDLGEQELTRQQDLARLVLLAQEFDDGARTLAEFVTDLQHRYGSDEHGRGVNLLTYHRAKGLEFDAVFLPRLNDGELPFRRSRSPEAVAEERRLLYVGLTRCKRHLFLTWLYGSKKSPSRFLEELKVGPAAAPAHRKRPPEDSVAVTALKAWRLERSKDAGVPAYVVLHNSTLEEIARRMPAGMDQLAAVPGMGPLRLSGYGEEILAVLKRLGG